MLRICPAGHVIYWSHDMKIGRPRHHGNYLCGHIGCNRYSIMMEPEHEAAYKLGGADAVLAMLPGTAFMPGHTNKPI